jgi:hypothetical protein
LHGEVSQNLQEKTTRRPTSKIHGTKAHTSTNFGTKAVNDIDGTMADNLWALPDPSARGTDDTAWTTWILSSSLLFLSGSSCSAKEEKQYSSLT